MIKLFKISLLCLWLFSAVDSVAQSEITLKLSPGDNNPRNSEGAFVTLKNGNILFVYTRYSGKKSGDHDPAILASRISPDGGKTWSADDKVVIEKEGRMNVMSVSLLRLKNGNIALFYLRKNSEEDCIPMMRISNNEGETWSEAVTCINDKQGYFVLNNDRVIQLKNGRLLMAVALHKVPGDKQWHEKAQLFSYYSDDNGRTWLLGSEVNTPKTIITQEPGVVELKNGEVMMFIRASGGVQYLSYSKDKGISWSTAVASNISSPISPATIKRIPKTKDLIMIWNNNDGSKAAIKGKRTPLTVAISNDEGRTWKHTMDIETDPDGWYCYIAAHFYKGEVLLAYCAGSQSANTHLSVTDVRRLELKSLYKSK